MSTENNNITNREYKDRLFKFIFGNPDNKEWTLSLYNAINGSDHKNPDDIILTTIEEVVYMGMKNDVSFLISDVMNFYEQQSSFNPNMPMRFFIYAGMVYSKFVENDKNYHRYSSKQQFAPTPRCICFYNGTTNKDDRVVLKLSDSFKSESDIELTVTMINVNYGHNAELLEACKPLKEYSFFIDRIRFHKKNTESIEKAIDMAIADLSDDSIIKSFLIANKAEVKRMCITEYDEERFANEQREEGKAEGKLEGLLEALQKMIASGMSEADAKEILGI